MDFNSFHFEQGVAVLKDLILTVLLWEGMVVLKELILTVFTFGVCGS